MQTAIQIASRGGSGGQKGDMRARDYECYDLTAGQLLAELGKVVVLASLMAVLVALGSCL